MKKCILNIVLLLVVSIGACQEMLWSSFKFYDGITLIPSMAGYHGGSISFNQRWNLSGVAGGPSNTTLTGHTNLFSGKSGIGVVLQNQNVSFVNSIQLSIPMAYHLDLGNKAGVSFGIMPDLFYQTINESKITNDLVDDPLLLGNKFNLDFGFSGQYNNKYLQIGGSIQRFRGLSNGLISSGIFTFANSSIPLADEFDVIQPSIIVYQETGGDWKLMSYVYYKWFEKIITGLGYNTGGQLLISTGYSFNNRWVFGYNYEHNLTDYSTFLGHSHEITLRYNLNSRFYSQRKYSLFSRPQSGMSTEKR